jgi:hypothetical protein
MATWLLCKQCGVKEWVQNHTDFVHCPTCRKPRYAVDDNDRPMVIWSIPHDWPSFGLKAEKRGK